MRLRHFWPILVAPFVMLGLTLPAVAQTSFFNIFDVTWRDLTELVALLGIIWGIGWLLLRPKIASDFVTKAEYTTRVTEIDNRLSDFEEVVQDNGKALDTRISRVEVQLEALPDKDSFHQLALEIKEQAGDLKGISATVKPLAASVQRIEQHLMDAKK